MAGKSDGNATFIWITFALVSVVIALVLTFTTADYARETSIKEAQKIEEALGEDTLLTVNRISAEWYKHSVDKFAIPMNLSAEMARKYSIEIFGFESEPLWRWLEKRSEAFLDLGYWFLRRIALFIVWIPFWIPMFLMAVMHGYWDREIKKTDFGYTSPVLNHWARRIMHFVTMVTLLLFVAPVAIDPWVFPFFLTVETVFAGIAIGNIQKRI